MTWSQEWKLNLNAEKSEICTFSTWSNNSSWNPAIFIGNQKVCVNTTPGLLSVIQSSSSFRQKAEELFTLLLPHLQHRQNITHFPSPPWQQSPSHEGRIATSVPGITG